MEMEMKEIILQRFFPFTKILFSFSISFSYTIELLMFYHFIFTAFYNVVASR